MSTFNLAQRGIARLPNGLVPFKDESLAGFIMRLAENHSYDRPFSILEPLKLGTVSLRLVAEQHADDPVLAEYLALTPEELARLSGGVGGGRRVLGHELPRELVNQSTRRACPLCLDEKPYHRALWDVSVLTVCPKHAVRLLDKCHACKRPLTWQVGPLTHCSSPKCAADLRMARCEAISRGYSSGVKAIEYLLHDGSCPGFHPAIRQLSVKDQLMLILHLGNQELGGRSVPRPTRLLRTAGARLHKILDVGRSQCVLWPETYHEVLEKWHQEPVSGERRYGVRKLSGSLLNTLDAINEPWSRLMANEIVEFVVSKPELATRAPEIAERRKLVPLDQRMMTLEEASDLLGVSYETMSELARENVLYRVPPTGSGAPALLWAERVHALAERRLGLLNKSEVLGILGCEKATVDKLRQAGLLPHRVEREQIAYTAQGVTVLLDDLRSRVRPSPAPAGKMVAMGEIARRVCMPGFDAVDIVLAVRAGKLTPRGVRPDAPGLRGLLFSDAEGADFARSYVSAQRATMSVNDAAVALGVKQQVAYDWVRSGLLETTTSDVPGETGQRVTDEALEAFQREYMTGVEFGKQHSIGPRLLAKNLATLGVKPVSGPTVDGARQALFRRADLERVDPEQLISGRSKLRPKTAADQEAEWKAAAAYDELLDRALRAEFGDGLFRHYNAYRDEAAGVVIQSMSARNSGTLGTYQFLLTGKHRDNMSETQRGFLALGFHDRSDYLLVPREQVAALLPDLPTFETGYSRMWRLTIKVGPSGELSPFGRWTRSLMCAAKSVGG